MKSLKCPASTICVGRAARNIAGTKKMLNQLLAQMTRQEIQQIALDIDRDYYMTAREAKVYGIVDHVI